MSTNLTLDPRCLIARTDLYKGSRKRHYQFCLWRHGEQYLLTSAATREERIFPGPYATPPEADLRTVRAQLRMATGLLCDSGWEVAESEANTLSEDYRLTHERCAWGHSFLDVFDPDAAGGVDLQW